MSTPEKNPDQEAAEIFAIKTAWACREEAFLAGCKHKEKQDNVYWNNTDKPIFIQQDVREHPFGGPGTFDSRTIIEPGQGIDVSILGLGREKK